VYTNGSPVTPEVADDLARLGVVSVAVSLDSHSATVHDHLHQRPGLFQLATAAIRLLAERGVRVVVEVIPTRANVRDVRGVVELARGLGAQAANLAELALVGRASWVLALDAEARRRLAARWQALAGELQGKMELTRSVEHEDAACGCEPAPAGGPLHGHDRFAGLLPDGRLTRCLTYPVCLGSLREAPLAEIWSASAPFSAPPADPPAATA
jgi:MoaA/NifB/PqqE/SkfB family radical SAM enzyme